MFKTNNTYNNGEVSTIGIIVIVAATVAITFTLSFVALEMTDNNKNNINKTETPTENNTTTTENNTDEDTLNAQAGISFDETEGVKVEVQLNSVQLADHIYVDVYKGEVSGGATNVSAPASDYSDDGSFLYANEGESGGIGTTATVYTSTTSGGGQITVIGVIDGQENIIQTYQYSS